VLEGVTNARVARQSRAEPQERDHRRGGVTNERAYHIKHTMSKKLLSFGLDVHAQSIALALAEGGGGAARTYSSIAHDLHALEKAFAKLRKAHPGVVLRV